MNDPIQTSKQLPAESLPLAEPIETQNTEPNQRLDELTNDAQQDEYRRAYLEQLRRMSCPGCGEDPTLPF